MHIFTPVKFQKDRTLVKFQKDWYKTVGGVAQCTSYLYTLTVSEPKKWLSSKCGKSDKNLSKVYMQTTCTSSDHDKNTCNVSKRTVGVKSHTRYQLSEPQYYGTMESQILCPVAFLSKRWGTKIVGIAWSFTVWTHWRTKRKHWSLTWSQEKFYLCWGFTALSTAKVMSSRSVTH